MTQWRKQYASLRVSNIYQYVKNLALTYSFFSKHLAVQHLPSLLTFIWYIFKGEMGSSPFCMINLWYVLFNIQHTFTEDQAYDWYWNAEMNDLGEIWLVREANTEQKVIKHGKNYKSRGAKGATFCLGKWESVIKVLHKEIFEKQKKWNSWNKKKGYFRNNTDKFVKQHSV